MPDEAAGFYAIVNHERFQHYKDRSPPWIKLHADVLDNYELMALSDAQKWHLVGLWILASKADNRLPVDEAWLARKIGAGPDFSVQPLIDAGFVMLARRKQGASATQAKRSPSRGRGETEERERVWLDALCTSWESRRGKPNRKYIRRDCAALVAEHGLRQVKAAWDGYLADRKDKAFATSMDFAANYLLHRDKHALESAPLGDGWVPMPDEPDMVAV